MGGAPEGITSLEAASVRPKAREIEPCHQVRGASGRKRAAADAAAAAAAAPP